MAVFTRRKFSAEKGICHMSETTITKLPDPSGFSPDPLSDVIRDGARKLIEQAIEAELSALMAASADEKLGDGRARPVRHGHLPERDVMTGVGPVPVKVPRVRDRGAGEDKITFTPSILPRYLRKTKSVEELLPWLYLKGVSTGDFQDAWAAPLGPDAKGLSSKTITRLKADWWKGYETWQKRDLSNPRFLYIWADGWLPPVRAANRPPDGLPLRGPALTSTRGWLRSEEDQNLIRGIKFPTNNAFW
jgi:transposase-like protein